MKAEDDEGDPGKTSEFEPLPGESLTSMANRVKLRQEKLKSMQGVKKIKPQIVQMIDDREDEASRGSSLDRNGF